MNHARRYVAAAALGGLLYAVGGYDGISVLDSVEAYDPKLDQWKRVESMSNARRHVAVGVLENDENDGSGPGNLKKKYHISSNKCPCTNRALPRLTTYTLGQNIKQVPPPQITAPTPLPHHFNCHCILDNSVCKPYNGTNRYA